MNRKRPLYLLALLLSISALSKIFAQDLTVNINKPEKNYTVDFSKPFSISFKDTSKNKANVALKQGEAVIILKENANLPEFTIKIERSGEGLAVRDKDGKEQNFSRKSFEVVAGDQSFTVKPSDVKGSGADSRNVVIDLNGTSSYAIDFAKEFQLSFKTQDAKPKDVVISVSSSDEEKKLTLKQKDLTKLTIPLLSDKGVLSVGDDKGKALNDDAGKPFKIDAGEFSVNVGHKTFKVSNKPEKPKPGETVTKNGCPPVVIIDNSMLADASEAGACQLCDIRSEPVSIKSKKEMKYSTDYIVIYDPLLKKDAYTICKHNFKRIKGDKDDQGKYYERYIKIRPKWFAPHVGSEIRFEVVNLPLNSTLKLLVDEQDIFNGGASQFASVINSLVNANVISPLSATTTTATDSTKKTGVQGGDDCFLPDMDAVANELLKYMTAFRISSCAIEQHKANLPVIFSRINERFGLAAVTAEQLGAQLTQKIDQEVNPDDKVKAVKKAEVIANALKALEEMKLLSYSTLRAKNRDYIEIKYADGSNVAGKPEYIRMSGGMKIDFSGGFVLTGLRDYSYVLKNIKYNYTPPGAGQAPRDTTGNVIIKEDEGNNQIGVCMLSHFYPRSSSHYNLGGTVGLMASTTLNLRLMVGGSIMVSSLFGSNNRIAFSGGLVWGKVKRLSEKDKDFFNGPRIVNQVPEFYSQASAPTPIDRTDHSWFFTVTMNFAGN